MSQQTRVFEKKTLRKMIEETADRLDDCYGQVKFLLEQPDSDDKDLALSKVMDEEEYLSNILRLLRQLTLYRISDII